jgi:hypothetical protein
LEYSIFSEHVWVVHKLGEQSFELIEHDCTHGRVVSLKRGEIDVDASEQYEPLCAADVIE